MVILFVYLWIVKLKYFFIQVVRSVLRFFNRIKEQIRDRKVFFQNFSYLTILQVFNIILPFVSYPYLIRVLGSEVYGKVLFAQTVIAYFSIIINFGFNISATKDIAENVNEKKVLCKYVTAVYILKFLLWCLSFLLLVLLIYQLQLLPGEEVLFLFSFGITLSELLIPQWYFQGVERMKYITLVNIVARSVFVCLIFVFVNSETDYLLVPLFNGVGSFVGGLIALYILVGIEKVRFVKSNIKFIYGILKESLPLFISSASVQIYINANKLIVGKYLGMGEVAIYDLGEKVIRLIKVPILMFAQAAFPQFSKEKNISKLNQFFLVGVGIALLLYGLVFEFSDSIVELVGGVGMSEAIVVMRILALSIIFIVIGQFYGPLRLIVFGYTKVYSSSILTSVLVYFCVILFLVLLGGINLISLSIVTVGVEFLTATFMLLYSKKFNLCK